MTVIGYLTDNKTITERTAVDKEYRLLKRDMTCQAYRFRDFAIYHVIVPSVKNVKGGYQLKYDVVVEIKTTALNPGVPRIDDLPTRVFSNCPSFIFGHAYRYNRSGHLIDWLLDKYNEAVKTNAPVRPPKNDFERSIYLALLYIHDEGADLVGTYKTISKKIDTVKEIISNVRTQDEIMNNAKERLVKERARKREQPDEVPEETVSEKAKKPRRKADDTVKPVKATATQKVNQRKTSTTKTAKTIKMIPKK